MRPPPPATGPYSSTPTQRTLPPGRTPARPYVPRQLGPTEESGNGLLWASLAGLAALLVLGAWLARGRLAGERRRTVPAKPIERPAVSPRVPAPSAPAPSPEPASRVEAPPELALTLQATRMSATLVNAVLSYRLEVSNHGAEPLGDIAVAGDMVAAHASRPAGELLGPDGAALPQLHRIAHLAPGESAVVSGDIRLPLNAITPIRRGKAALFVPLARLRAVGRTSAGEQVCGSGTFLVGQPAPSERLQPFRLDLGPRMYSKIGQHLLPASV